MPSIFSRIKMAKDTLSPLYYGRINQSNLANERLSYENTIKKLNSLQTNASVLQAAKERGRASHVEQAANVDATVKYLQRTGITLERLDNLSIIHVSGTKGKGTTCALCESILRHHGYRTGFYSSPHLVAAKERIRINGVPLSHQDFARHFNEVYDAIEKKKESESDMPAYFKFLTVMAFNVFIKEQVDVAIVEVGIGGEYDCTNCIRNPSIVGITSLGLDHTKLLGETLEEIAWQKGGIMKPGAIAFTVLQKSPPAMQVLQERAENRQCDLYVAPSLNSYLWDTSVQYVQHVDDIQALNISLALQLSHHWMTLQSPFEEKKIEEKILHDEEHNIRIAKPFQVTRKMAEGLKNCSWPGRTQIIPRQNVTYFLDGAHTEESIKYCSDWFKQSSKILQESSNIIKILIFNSTGQREVDKFLEILSSHNFDIALFTTNLAHTKVNSSSDIINYNITLDEQSKKSENHLRIWKNLIDLNNGNSHPERFQALPTVAAALSFVNDFASKEEAKCHVLITGSLHLVGSSLSILDPELSEPVYNLPTDLIPLQSFYNGLQAIL